MPKPSIAELLKASGFTSFTPEAITRAINALHGNVGANADERDWSAIMVAGNPLAAAETALTTMYQDRSYLLRNADQLVQNGYAYSQAEFTYRTLYARLGQSYSPAWSVGTVMEEYGRMSDRSVESRAQSDAFDLAPTPALTITSGADGFSLSLSIASMVKASDGTSLGRFNAGTTTLGDQSSVVSGTLTPTSDAGKPGAKSIQYFTIGTANADTVDTSGAGSQIDYIQTGGGGDTVTAGAGDDVVYLGAGDDVATGGDGDDEIRGGPGRDTLWGDAGRDTIFGNGDDDLIYGGDGDDTIQGGQGNDTVYGGAGNDQLEGGSTGDDVLYGEAGNDVLIGGAGVDTLNGDNGDDVFDYGLEADLVASNAFVDTIAGGADADEIRITAGTAVTITNTVSWARVAGVEKITAGASAGAISISAGDDVSAAGIATIDLSGDTDATGANVIDISADAADSIITAVKGSAGADTITGNSIAQTIEGGDGNDSIAGAGGADALYGGNGDDRFLYAQTGDLFSGTQAVDTIDGGAGTNTLVLATPTGGTQYGFDISASDSFFRITNVSRLEAGGAYSAQFNLTLSDDAYEAGIRVIDLSPDTETRFNANFVNVSAETGSSNGYTLIGHAGIDYITGGAGPDTINGGGDRDKMLGKGGNDVFVMSADTPGGERINGGSTSGNEVNSIRIDATADLTNLLATNSDGTADTLYALLTDGAINQVVLNGDSANVTFQGDFLTGQAINFAKVTSLDTSDVVINVSAGASRDFSALTFQSDFRGSGYYGLTSGTNSVTFNVVGGSASVTIVGTSIADIINGGGGADTLRGGPGVDQVLLGADAQADTVRADEGDGQMLIDGTIAHLDSDRIEQFKAANDKFAVSGAGTSVILNGAAATQTAGHAFQDVATGTFDLNGSVGGAYITGASAANLRTFSDVKAAIGTVANETIGEEAYFVVRDGSGGGNAGVYHFRSVTANDTVDVGEIELLGLVLTAAGADLTGLAAGNFVFA